MGTLANSVDPDEMPQNVAFIGVARRRKKLHTSGLEISEKRHLPSITKNIGIYGKMLIFTRNIKNFTCPAA